MPSVCHDTVACHKFCCYSRTLLKYPALVRAVVPELASLRGVKSVGARREALPVDQNGTG